MERDKINMNKSIISTDFNSHAHVERDSLKILSVKFISYFNSHAHVERDISGETAVIKI